MKFIQGIVILITSSIIIALTYCLCKKFGRKDLFIYGLIPIFIFVVGFILRLSNDGVIIDAGFFMTEISYIFLTILWVLALILGQLKYWKK
jgi:hypothetical protein